MGENNSNRKWVKRIDTSVIELFPIQFANCDRLNNNNAVYIFDEVGSGKTISSGIMALEYLDKNPESNVLVITTNALVRSSENAPEGQFKSDWLKKLPFISLRYENRIKVINNHHSNIKNQAGKYGLVIIDEAHLFLNKNSNRYKELCGKIKADKVVFLTATPK